MAAVAPTSTQDLAIQESKARRETRESDRKHAEEQFAKDREAQNKMNMAKMEADAKLRPTPTPEEIALARAGHNKDVKEPDGSPEQNPAHPVANAAQQIEVGREIPPAKSTSVEERELDEHRDTAATKPPSPAKK